MEAASETADARLPLAEDDLGFSLLNDGPARGPRGAGDSLALLHVASQLRQFVLLGVPAAGKTTVLRHMALQAARLRQSAPRMAPLPVLKYLPAWRDDESFAVFVARDWPFDGHPQDAAAAGDVDLYFDGPNEMGRLATDHASALAEWSAACDTARVVVTCRLTNYVDGLQLKDLPRVMVQPLDRPAIQATHRDYPLAWRRLGTRSGGGERSSPD